MIKISRRLARPFHPRQISINMARAVAAGANPIDCRLIISYLGFKDYQTEVNALGAETLQSVVNLSFNSSS